jgi:hypothetical protein
MPLAHTVGTPRLEQMAVGITDNSVGRSRRFRRFHAPPDVAAAGSRTRSATSGFRVCFACATRLCSDPASARPLVLFTRRRVSRMSWQACCSRAEPCPPPNLCSSSNLPATQATSHALRARGRRYARRSSPRSLYGPFSSVRARKGVSPPRCGPPTRARTTPFRGH